MRSLDPLEGVAAFMTVAKHLSFTKAAEELRMSRATVGAQVQALEANSVFGFCIARHVLSS